MPNREPTTIIPARRREATRRTLGASPSTASPRPPTIPGRSTPIAWAITRAASATLLALAMITGLLVLGSTPALASTNDYPYRNQTNTSTVDPWGFTERQCTSFAAWRSHQRGHDMHSTAATPWGNASHWDQEAVALGVAVNATPTVGSFAQWHAGEKRTWTSGSYTYWFTADSDGHVAYVAAVYADGTVLLQDYNGFAGNRTYGTKRLPRGGVPRYIHFAG